MQSVMMNGPVGQRISPLTNAPADTGRKLNAHKTFRRRPGRFLNLLCTLNLRSVSTGTRPTKNPAWKTKVNSISVQVFYELLLISILKVIF